MPPFVRREVRSLAADDPTLPAYAAAVAAMQARDADNPTSWSYQAGMHGRTGQPQLPLFNGCQHGGWFFVSWHRMYVYYFERIVRAAVVAAGGPDDWALPYWNYGLNGTFASLPPQFRAPNNPDGSANPLYVAQRRAAINAGGIMPPQVTSAAQALSRPLFVGTTQFGGGQTAAGQFWNQTGVLENQPHNVVHDTVGGPGGWMANPFTAAQDPIFWLHHANIDRLWSVWDAGNANPTDAAWLSQTFDFFDENGAQVTLTAAQILDTVADLDYTYDPSPAPAAVLKASLTPTMTPAPSPDAEPELLGATESPTELVGAPTRVEVAVDARARDALRSVAPSDGAAPRTILNLEDIEAPENPGTVYGVYVNLPDEAPADQEASHHVGNLSFFGVERARDPRGDEHAHGLRYSYDITDVVGALARRGLWDDSKVYVTLRPIEVIPPEDDDEGVRSLAAGAPAARRVASDPPVTVGRISLAQG
jgi:tyrosinase